MIEQKVYKELERVNAPLSVVFPSGNLAYVPSPDKTRLILKTQKALLHLAARNIGALGQDYVNGDIELRGTPRDLMAAVSTIVGPNMVVQQPSLRERILRRFHSTERDRKNVQFHYDASDDFYRLWLDERRVYSCAYYDEGSTLEQAQENKLQLICRKLNLRSGEAFLDIGMGWGGLLLYAAKNYGVRATGITLSKNQHAYVSDLIKQHKLEHLVNVELTHYKDLPSPMHFDKIASVGMSEHVGTANLPGYFQHLHSLLKPTGMLLNHCITASSTTGGVVGNGMGDFIGKYIFPGGELQHTSEVLRVAANAGFEMVDTENLRPHYARTLWDWSDRLEANLEEAIHLTSGETVRAYRMYLAGTALGFEKNWVALHQFLFVKEEASYPFNRKYMYMYM